MRLKHVVLGAAIASLVGGSALISQAAADTFIPLFTYRTGPFANSGIPIANGMHDYFTMLNERDGGIGGSKLVVEDCETGYKNEKGVECYEALKNKKPAVINPYSTGITLALIPKAAVDHIPVLSMAYGLSASAVGKDFPWIFNPPSTYWDGLSIILRLRRQQGRWPRQAQGQDRRLHLFRRWLWPRTAAAVAPTRQGLRLQREGVSCAGRSDAEPGKSLAQRPPRPSRLDDHVGLGRHESDRGAGSRQNRLPAGSVHRHLVVGQRG
jgi:hypothetical protein